MNIIVTNGPGTYQRQTTDENGIKQFYNNVPVVESIPFSGDSIVIDTGDGVYLLEKTLCSCVADGDNVLVIQSGQVVKTIAFSGNSFNVTGSNAYEVAASIQSFFPTAINVPQTSIEASVERDMQIGKSLLIKYLSENKQLNITTQQSVDQLIKFQGIKALLEVGALQAARDLLYATITPDEIFTQSRKNYYLNELNNAIQ